MAPDEHGDVSKPRRRLSDDAFSQAATEFAAQSERLSLQNADGSPGGHDPVIVTTAGSRLPPVPLAEAHQLNRLKDEPDGGPSAAIRDTRAHREAAQAKLGSPGPAMAPAELLELGRRERSRAATTYRRRLSSASTRHAESSLGRSVPPSHTHPLFPPLPLYGPPSLLRSLQSATFRVSSFVLSLSFLGVVVVGSLVTGIPSALRRAACRLTLRDPDADRPFYAEEKRRKVLRKELNRAWPRRRLSEGRIEFPKMGRPSPPSASASTASSAAAAASAFVGDNENLAAAGPGINGTAYTPTAGGPDPLVPDVVHYARRVGLDVEAFEVQTEDGFIIDLWHVFDPREHTARPAEARAHRGPGNLFGETTAAERAAIEQDMLRQHAHLPSRERPKFPVLLVHGLLQSAGAYCVNDDDSLAFYLCKSGYDVWLGNNRCGFHPKHAVLQPSDPRMWCWNIRHMGVLDLPALASRVLRETRFARLGLVCHSQGTTEALVALAKEQRPELGDALTVFCALAPAAYAGPLISKLHFKFMRVISPGLFRLLFGIHAFIPLMMQVHPLVPGPVYGWLGYRVFSFLFGWTDARWDRGLRNRMFQFAPVYVSAESMRWWLGREGFARHKCILSTKDEWRAEEREEDEKAEAEQEAGGGTTAEEESQAPQAPQRDRGRAHTHHSRAHHHHRQPGATAWYDERVPPFALWVCGRDDLVDGRRLLRRLLPRPVFAALDRGRGNRSTASGALSSTREPHVRVVHAKVLPEYEHLDVLWAMDAVDQVFCEVRAVLWKTCTVRELCRVPKGCESVEPWRDPGRRRPSPAGGRPRQAGGGGPVPPRDKDESAGAGAQRPQ